MTPIGPPYILRALLRRLLLDTLSRDARRTMLAQGLLALAAAAVFLLAAGGREALAAVYGGLISIIITLWLARRVRRASEARSTGAGMMVIASATFLHCAVAVLLLALGLWVLKWPALPLLSGFAVTQFGFLATLRRAPG